MRKKSKDNNGFTLIEQLVSLSLVVLMTIIFSSFTADVLRSSARFGSYAEVQENSRLVLDRIAQEAKTAQGFAISSNRLVISLPGGGSRDIVYDPVSKSVNLVYGATNLPLSGDLVDVTAVIFSAVGNDMVEVSLSARQKKAANPGESPYTWQSKALMAPRLSIY